MKVWTRVEYIWDEATERYEVDHANSSSYEYSGSVEHLKYSDEKKQASTQMAEQNAMQKDAFNLQKDQLGKLNDSFSRYLSNNVGFDPAQLAMLQSQFLNNNNQQFNDAASSVRSALRARGSAGGNLPVGGDWVRAMSGLAGQRASSTSGGIANIGLQNLQAALTNRFNAGSILSGNAATLSSPISTFGAGASNALDIRAKLGMAPTFGNAFFPAFGGSLGAGLGGALTGKVNRGMGG